MPMMTEPAFQSPQAVVNDSFRMHPQYDNSFHSARDKQPSNIPLAEYILSNKGSSAFRNQKALNKIIETQQRQNS